MDRKKQIFISYNQKDRNVAAQVRQVLSAGDLPVWLDVEQVIPGDRIADKINQGLSASDYYLLLISENSNLSTWVKQELSLAFDLSAKKKITIVPLLLDDAPVPFELRGLLYIDLRKSVADGLKELKEFFRSQFSKISQLEPKTIVRKSGDDAEVSRRACQDSLRNLQLGELRFILSSKLSRQQIEIIWFDLFERQMADEAPGGDVSMCCVKLLDRAKREDLLAKLIALICRSHPFVSR